MPGVHNRLTGIDGPWANDTITYQYNELGQLKNLIPQGGQAITYYYDYDPENPGDVGIGRLKDIKAGGYSYSYGYTGVNPLIQSLARPNGSITEYLYNDPLKRLTEITNKNSAQAIINKYAFTYNNLDVIGTETITSGEPITTFTEGLITYDYNNLNQLLSSTNPDKLFTYDADGNMTQGYTPEGYVLTMTYDAENRLTVAEYTDSSSVVHRTRYFYSGDNLLAGVKKYEDWVQVNYTRYIRGGFLPIQERDESNYVAREYIWGLNYGGGIGGLLHLRQGGLDYSYLYDGKGNVSALLDSGQNVVSTYRYDAFGVLKEKTGTLNQIYQFSTKLYDPETGLSYYGFRFYSPSTGRWITRDPIEEAGGINLYEFTLNNPVNYIDPWGLESKNLEITANPHSFKGYTGYILMGAGGAALLAIPNPYLKVAGIGMIGVGAYLQFWSEKETGKNLGDDIQNIKDHFQPGLDEWEKTIEDFDKPIKQNKTKNCLTKPKQESRN